MTSLKSHMLPESWLTFSHLFLIFGLTQPTVQKKRTKQFQAYLDGFKTGQWFGNGAQHTCICHVYVVFLCESISPPVIQVPQQQYSTCMLHIIDLLMSQLPRSYHKHIIVLQLYNQMDSLLPHPQYQYIYFHSSVIILLIFLAENVCQ